MNRARAIEARDVHLANIWRELGALEDARLVTSAQVRDIRDSLRAAENCITDAISE